MEDEATHILKHVEALRILEVVHLWVKVELSGEGDKELVRRDVVQQADQGLVMLFMQRLPLHCQIIKVDDFLVDQLKHSGSVGNDYAIAEFVVLFFSPQDMGHF